MDLYEILGVSREAQPSEIKKAYHRAALSSHPDKVPEAERAEADVRFKAISQAYEILYDDDQRQLYDTHGMAAFEKGGMGPGGMGAEMDMNDILGQMFGMNMNGGGPMPGGAMPGGRGRPQKGRDEEEKYGVSLEDLYKGKTTRFASTKNIICGHCKGTGGKDKAKPKTCDTCKGAGQVMKLQMLGQGLATRVAAPCTTCNGAGQFFKDKERCKRCKGARVTQEKKMLELYIPPGARQGERIVLKGEADQHPDQSEPGDIVFTLVEEEHDDFERAGADLHAPLNITLAEALTGFNRVVVKHLDGRGLQISTTKGEVLRPGQILRIAGEGMPVKKSDSKGDLFLSVDIEFPKDGWLEEAAGQEKLKELLPQSPPDIKTEEVDEVEYDPDATLEDFGAGSMDPTGGAEWEDEDDAGAGQPQCAQQ